MRILVHDYSGHPFQVQLSRSLAARGHSVEHVFSAEFLTPKGPLQRQDSDGPTFEIKPISLGEQFRKYSYVKRLQQERKYGKAVAAEILRFRPDIVISSNAPLDTQIAIKAACNRNAIPFIFWVQDIYSEAIRRILTKKLGPLGRAIGHYYEFREYSMLRGSEAVVVITEDFLPILARHGVPSGKMHVIENWAPLGQLTPLPRENYWVERLDLSDRPRFVYSGTLGLKHDPQVLVELAQKVPCEVLVLSEGAKADQLKAVAATMAAGNLKVMPWVPFGDLSAVLSAADVLVAFIDDDAGVFCVPSKVLSYLCIGRPVLAAVPEANLAHRMIQTFGLGRVVPPGDNAAFVEQARALAADAELRKGLGDAARRFAEEHFDIDAITERFEDVIGRAMRARSAAGAPVNEPLAVRRHTS